MITPIETFEHNGCRVTISYDECDEHNDPRWEATSLMVANGHRQYTLGDENRGHDGYDEATAALEHFAERHRKPLEVFARWLKVYGGATVVMPLWLLDHSGLAMSTTEFWMDRAHWDSGIVGVIFDTPQLREELGESATTDDMMRVLVNEVAEYNAFLQNSVLQWTVEVRRPGACGHDGCTEHMGWETVESTGGILYVTEDDLSYARSDAREAAEAQVRG